MCDAMVVNCDCVCCIPSLLPSSQFMVDYEDSQLGAPEEDEEEELVQGGDEKSGRGKGGALDRSDFDKLLLESAVEDFQKNFADQLQL